MEDIENNTKKTIIKPGKTIVLRTESEFIKPTLVGLVNHVQIDTHKHFFVFDSLDNSIIAYDNFKNDSNLSVRYAYYRVFFKSTGIDETTDYTHLKNEHSNYVTTNTNGQVLYYKLYKKDNKFIGCGDLTVDTKESMDKLLNKEECKTFSFDVFTGTHYRYNKNSQQKN